MPCAEASKAPPIDEPGAIAMPATIGISSPPNRAPTPCVVQRLQPTLGPMNPNATPASANHTSPSVRLPRPLT